MTLIFQSRNFLKLLKPRSGIGLPTIRLGPVGDLRPTLLLHFRFFGWSQRAYFLNLGALVVFYLPKKTLTDGK